MSKYKITLAPRSTNMTGPQVLRATRIIMNTMPSFTLEDANAIVIGMLKGASFEYESDVLPDDTVGTLFYACWKSLELTPLQWERKHYNDLLECGANGDEQAAVEYCKAVMAGKVR